MTIIIIFINEKVAIESKKSNLLYSCIYNNHQGQYVDGVHRLVQNGT